MASPLTMLDHAFAYLSFFVFFGIAWIVLYVMRRDLRSEMLKLSIFCAPLGILGEYFARQDYYFLTVTYPSFWTLQAALIGFVYGGVAVAVYAAWRHLHFTRYHSKTPKHPLWLPTLAIGGSLVMFIGMRYFDINSVYLSMMVMFIGAFSILFLRPDLWGYALGSGIAVMILSTAFYLLFQYVFDGALSYYWNGAVLNWGSFFGVPMEELLWAFAWGFLIGPSYEFEFTSLPKRT